MLPGIPMEFENLPESMIQVRLPPYLPVLAEAVVVPGVAGKPDVVATAVVVGLGAVVVTWAEVVGAVVATVVVGLGAWVVVALLLQPGIIRMIINNAIRARKMYFFKVIPPINIKTVKFCTQAKSGLFGLLFVPSLLAESNN